MVAVPACRACRTAELAPLMSAGVVIARVDTAGQIVVSCADLARVTDLDCPLPRYKEGFYPYQDFLRAEDCSSCRIPAPAPPTRSSDRTRSPSPAPTPPGCPSRPCSFPPTVRPPRRSGSVPSPRSRCPCPEQDQRRPASGRAAECVRSRHRPAVRDGVHSSLHRVRADRLGDHRRAGTAQAVRVAARVRGPPRRAATHRPAGNRCPTRDHGAFAVGLATVQSLVGDPARELGPSQRGYLTGLGWASLAAFAVSLIALPFMNAATRFDTVRFE